MKSKTKAWLSSLATALAILNPGAGAAQDFPRDPITIIVPFGAGGGVDSVARTVANEWSQQFGHLVVVENQAGAAGNIGSASAARSKPNGYTLLLASNSNSYNDFLYSKTGYSPSDDLTSIIHIGRVPIVLVGSKTVPATNVKEVVELARSKPGTLNFVSYGVGSSGHLLLEMFRKAADIDITHVPYNNPQVYPDLIAGRTQFIFANQLEASQYIENDQLRAIGIVGDQRSADFPELQSFAEQGYPQMDAEVWWGLMAPTGTPAPVVERLNEIMNKVLSSENVKTRLNNLGAQPVGGTAEDFAAFFNSEREKWRQVIADANIKAN